MFRLEVEDALNCHDFLLLLDSVQIVTAMGKTSEGVALLERALHLDPSSKIIQQDLMRLQAKQKQEMQKERSLYKKMFNFQNNTPSGTRSEEDKRKIKLTVKPSNTIPTVNGDVSDRGT